MTDYRVKWYSGRVTNERPISIIVDGEEIQILKILKEELLEDAFTRNRKRLFIVKTEMGKFEILYNQDNYKDEVKPIK
ncbi:hypothetical protein KAT73_01440 [candidate division WOR-3 bacterium]|nr:hypothetical protein [candidate division WOR-3 bacterium]